MCMRVKQLEYNITQAIDALNFNIQNTYSNYF